MQKEQDSGLQQNGNLRQEETGVNFLAHVNFGSIIIIVECLFLLKHIIIFQIVKGKVAL